MTPSGRFLTSWNSRRPEYVEEKLREALALWEALDDEERLPSNALTAGPRPEDHYPEGGLVLQVFTRDLPRDDGPGCSGWRADAWNLDHLWLGPQEARALAEGALPEDAVRRIVRIHGRDNVRGQSSAYEDSRIVRASLSARATERTEGGRTLSFEGEGAVEETGTWRVKDREGEPTEQRRSFSGAMAGRAEWNGERFTAFELAWTGMREGATQFNGRSDDPGPAPMAVVFRLAPKNDRVAPSFFWDYGWR